MTRTRGLWGLGTALLALSLSGPAGAAGQEATVTRDIPYVADPHAEQHLDLHWPAGRPSSSVLFIHGLFLFGHSSGCTLAAVVASDSTHLSAVGLSPSDLAGVVPMGCILDNHDAALRGITPDDIREAFAGRSGEVTRFGTPENFLGSIPSFFVGPHVPPTLVVVARQERFFPAILEQGARFVRRLLEQDVPADLVIVPSGTHRSSVEDLDEPGDPTFRAIRSFIEETTAARETAGDP